MNTFFGAIAVAIVIEAIVTYIREIAEKDKKFSVIEGVTIGLGILAAVAYNIDILQNVGLVSAIPFVGYIFTGILLSRSSNYVYELISKLEGVGK